MKPANPPPPLENSAQLEILSMNASGLCQQAWYQGGVSKDKHAFVVDNCFLGLQITVAIYLRRKFGPILSIGFLFPELENSLPEAEDLQCLKEWSSSLSLLGACLWVS